MTRFWSRSAEDWSGSDTGGPAAAEPRSGPKGQRAVACSEDAGHQRASLLSSPRVQAARSAAPALLSIPRRMTDPKPTFLVFFFFPKNAIQNSCPPIRVGWPVGPRWTGKLRPRVSCEWASSFHFPPLLGNFGCNYLDQASRVPPQNLSRVHRLTLCSGESNRHGKTLQPQNRSQRLLYPHPPCRASREGGNTPRTLPSFQELCLLRPAPAGFSPLHTSPLQNFRLDL